MKRWMGLLLAAVLCLCVGTSLAEVRLPEMMARVFEGELWEGWTPVAMDEQTLAGVQRPAAAVVMQREGRNVLCLLERERGATWRISEVAARAIYQGDRLPFMTFEGDADMVYGFYYEYTEGKDGHSESYGVQPNLRGLWILNGARQDGPHPSGVGQMPRVIIFRMYMEHVDQATSNRGRVYSKYFAKLNSFDIEAYPRTYEEALAQQNWPQPLSGGEQQNPLPQGRPAALARETATLYSGPTGDYLRGADWVADGQTELSMLGLQGSTALVTFQQPGGPVQYGYMAIAALESVEGVEDLQMEFLRGHVTEGAPLLGGPDGDTLRMLQAGDEVLYLATLGSDWSYVEVRDGTPARGFVHSAILSYRYDLEYWESEAALAPARAVYTVDVVDDPYRTSSPKVLGTIEAGEAIFYLDRLYDQWACVVVDIDGEMVEAFVPMDAVESANENGLGGNG